MTTSNGGETYSLSKDFKKAEDFVNYLVTDNTFSIGSYWDTSNATSSRYIYRGQSNKAWRLIPAAFRDQVDFSRYTPQIPNRENKSYLPLQMKAEEYSVFKFLQYADEAGMNCPIDFTIKNVHRKMLDKGFNGNNELEDFEGNFPDTSMLQLFAFAQHHGVPTRLMDWTESPLIAAYFAAENHLLTPKNEPCDFLSVFCLSVDLINSCEELTIEQAPRATNSYMKEQQGVFTLITKANKYYFQHKKWPTIEDVVKPYMNHIYCKTPSPFIRISLPTSEARRLLEILYRLGIKRLSLKPSYSHAEAEYEYRKLLFPKD